MGSAAPPSPLTRRHAKLEPPAPLSHATKRPRTGDAAGRVSSPAALTESIITSLGRLQAPLEDTTLPNGHAQAVADPAGARIKPAGHAVHVRVTASAYSLSAHAAHCRRAASRPWPEGHEHWNPPAVFEHASLHPPLPTAHSFTSTHAPPDSVYPAGQLHAAMPVSPFVVRPAAHAVHTVAAPPALYVLAAQARQLPPLL
jgi:hypothetical protein